MVRYHLTIEQFTDNDAYGEELKAWNDEQRYNHRPYETRPPEPQRERSLKVLSVTVTDVEFAAIKKAALAVMV